MGCQVREKHIRTLRKTRLPRTESDYSDTTITDDGRVGKSIKATSEGKPIFSNVFHNPLNETTMSRNEITSNSDLDVDDGWGYCSGEQLEEVLLKNLDFFYHEAINKLVTMGYDEEVALQAILRNGHCYGGIDVWTNILHNSLSFRSKEENAEEIDAEPCLNLRQLEEYSLAGMVCLLQQVRPHLSKGDAMWCLFMSDLHIGRASEMEIPFPLMSAGSEFESLLDSSNANSGSDVCDGGTTGDASALCRFHRCFPYSSELTLQREIEFPERFNLSPSMKSLLKRNVAMFAAGFRANSQLFHSQSQVCPSVLSAGKSLNGFVAAGNLLPNQNEESQNEKNQDAVNSVMDMFRDLNLDDNTKVPKNQKDETILSLINQIEDLEKQVKEHREWAHQKAMQAANKISRDLIELKTLRMEREEILLQKTGEQTLEDSTMKRFSEMEIALRKASGQVDYANAAVRKFETENAEINAEMEAFKLNASESVTTCLEVAKREKKFLKKLLAWEKQKTKILSDTAAEKQKISDLQRQLVLTKAATMDAEAKWRQEQKFKEIVLMQLEEERRVKEASEINNRTKLESLRSKLQITFQCHKDDLRRLEQEYTRIKESSQSVEEKPQSSGSRNDKLDQENPQDETIVNSLHDFDLLEKDSMEKEIGCGRECVICLKDEVSVVFLPCAHQVICTNCNDKYGKKGKAKCPYCCVPIDRRIRVYGASS